MNTSIFVDELYLYPIKSCGAIPVKQAMVTRRGIEFDRLMMVVDPEGTFYTQRELPRMALIECALAEHEEGQLLTLRAPGVSPLDLIIGDQGIRRQVIVWRSTCVAVDQGERVAEWLSDFLETSVRLVRIADDFQRELDATYRLSAGDETGFADGYPVLLTSQASLGDLNSRLAQPLPINRFRPNLVVRGCEPFAEDGWKRIRVGSGERAVEFALVKPCARCQLTTVDQQTAEVGKEPLATLATYRRINGKVLFGQNLIGVNTGQIQVGDPVEVLA